MIRFGIVGAGRMGNAHAGNIHKLKDACVSKIYDIIPEHSQKLSEKFGGEICSSLEELTSSPDVDCVLISSPTYVHQDGVHAAMKSGKAIFCEKPLCRSPEEAKKLLELVGKYDKPFVPGFVRRHASKTKKLKEIVESGMLGKLLYCNVDCTFGGYVRMPGDFFTDFDLCGGVILDMLAHHVDLANWFFGKAKRVYADSLLMNKSLPLPADYAASVVTYENDVICNLICSWQRFGRSGSTMEIYGEKGGVLFDDATSKLTVYELGKEPRTIETDTGPDSNNGLFQEAKAMVDLLEGKEVAVPTIQDAYDSVAVGFAMIDSVKSGQAVTL